MATTKDDDQERDKAVAEAKGRGDAPVGMLRELKDAAEAAGAKARDSLLGRAGDVDRRPPPTEEPVERQKLDEMRLRATGQHVEAQRGMAAKENIMSSLTGKSSITGAIKDKLTQRTDVVNETRLAREHGGAHRKDPTEPTGSEHIPPGPT